MGEPPLILHVCAVDFTAWHFVRPLMMAQRRWGYRVAACCGRGPYFDRLVEEGVAMHAVPVRRALTPLAHMTSLRRMRRLMRTLRPAIVHAHTPIAGFLGRRAARQAGVPSVFATIHGFLFHEGSSPLAAAAARAAERMAARWSDALFFVSLEDHAEAMRMNLLPDERLIYCGNGVDAARLDPARWELEAFDVRSRLRIPPDAVVVGFCGRIVREKGIEELVEAMASVREGGAAGGRPLHLLLVGDALPSDRHPWVGKARELAARRGMADALHVTGMVDDPAPYVAAMDVFVLPSWREGMPVSLLEAMALARPCIATRIRGAREAVVDDTHGLLVPARDRGALAEALARLVASEGLRRRLGAAARARVVAEYTQERVTDILRAAYPDPRDLAVAPGG